MNKVKRGDKWKGRIYMARAGEEMEIEKYTWICTVCGREWLMKQDAQRCKHCDYVWYGTTRVKCLNAKNSLEMM